MVHQGAGDRCSTREGDPTQEWVGHWLAGGEQLHCVSFALYFIININYSFSVPINCLYFNLQTITFCFQLSPLSHWRGG